jgi:hypothetical protein
MPTKPSFDSISLADLLAVTGGCGKKKECPPCPPPQQPPPQAAAAPRPQAGPQIDTTVQIAGY